jgi:uncharacterized protein YegJ (DUF2314 family)
MIVLLFHLSRNVLIFLRGLIVKLIFVDIVTENAERMWVVVKDVSDPERIVGVLDNDPVLINIRSGDEVLFHPNNIIDITAIE